MKLKSLAIHGFRGFAGEHLFNLDADAIIVIAANGQGKTSFFDAILWGLTGLIPRLGDSPQVVSLYTESGEARVEVELVADDGRSLEVIRRDPGGLSVRSGKDQSDGAGATSLLHSVLWPAAGQAPDGDQALAGALTRSVYLQQDLVRDFVEGDDDKARFTAVSELAGAGRVTELAVELESARLRWTRATNSKDKELEEARRRLESHQAQLGLFGSFDATSADDVARRITSWWARAGEFEVALRQKPVPPATRAVPGLEDAMQLLDVVRRTTERRLTSAESLRTEFDQHARVSPSADLQKLGQDVEQAEAHRLAAQKALESAEQAASLRRRERVERRQAAEELGALAELALRHIEGSCPVCGQEQKEPATRARLQELIAAAGSSAGDEPDVDTASLAAEVQDGEENVAAAKALLRRAETVAREDAAWQIEREERLRGLGIMPEGEVGDRQALDGLIAASKSASEAIAACLADGERLSVELVGVGERARSEELKATIRAEVADLRDLEGEIEARQRTGKLTTEILEALREASASVVAAELDRIDPLLQRIYSAADPHPCFRAIRLLSTVSRGRGRLSAALGDPLAGLSVDQPDGVLSSSQLNALAVSVFLALNLGLPSVPLPIAMLDDPLQSLDDVNLLGLVDLMRRTKGRRQLLLSTHDRRFGALLARKLRPVRDDGSTRVIEIDGWGRRGPEVREVEAPRDSEPLRIAVPAPGF